MKALPWLISCLLVITVINFGLDLHQHTQIALVSASLTSLVPAPEAKTGFEQRLALASDLESLRQLARVQRSKSENVQQLVSLLTDSFRRMTDAAVLRSGLLLAISSSLLVVARLVIPGGQRGR